MDENIPERGPCEVKGDKVPSCTPAKRTRNNGLVFVWVKENRIDIGK